jgi:small subunit ribosomal protein S33
MSASIADLSRKIFQRLPQRHIASGNKVISKQLKGEKVASWFQKPLQLYLPGDDPNFMLLDSERLGRLDQMKRRGKTTPKKGAGKRSGKK